MLNPALETWINVPPELGVAAHNVECERGCDGNGFGVVRRHEGVHGEGFDVVSLKDFGGGQWRNGVSSAGAASGVAAGEG